MSPSVAKIRNPNFEARKKSEFRNTKIGASSVMTRRATFSASTIAGRRQQRAQLRLGTVVGRVRHSVRAAEPTDNCGDQVRWLRPRPAQECQPYLAPRCGRERSDFGLWISFGFRISSFEFPAAGSLGNDD